MKCSHPSSVISPSISLQIAYIFCTCINKEQGFHCGYERTKWLFLVPVDPTVVAWNPKLLLSLWIDTDHAPGHSGIPDWRGVVQHCRLMLKGGIWFNKILLTFSTGTRTFINRQGIFLFSWRLRFRQIWVVGNWFNGWLAHGVGNFGLVFSRKRSDVCHAEVTIGNVITDHSAHPTPWEQQKAFASVYHPSKTEDLCCNGCSKYAVADPDQVFVGAVKKGGTKNSSLI